MAEVSRRHHVVTEGYLRHWAQPDENGKPALILESLEKGWKKSVSPNDACARRDFNILRAGDQLDDALEQQWEQVVETPALPRIRSIQSPDDLDVQRTDAVKAFAAMHVARSFPMLLLFNASWDKKMHNVEEAEANERLRVAFLDDHGREPEPGELGRAWLEVAGERRHTNQTFLEIVVETYLRTLDCLDSKYVQLARVAIPRTRLITSDNPVVLDNGLQVGLHNGVAINQAPQIWMPLRPELVIHFTTRPETHGEVPPLAVQRLNSQMRRNAVHFTVIHPADESPRDS